MCVYENVNNTNMRLDHLYDFTVHTLLSFSIFSCRKKKVSGTQTWHKIHKFTTKYLFSSKLNVPQTKHILSILGFFMHKCRLCRVNSNKEQ